MALAVYLFQPPEYANGIVKHATKDYKVHNTSEYPAVSTVMPVYNAEKTVRQAVDSIRKQTLQDWELIAVDDGSTDASGELLDHFAREDGRIRILHTHRQGVVASSNTGLAEARAPYIARMDADDVSHPLRLERQVNFLKTEPQVDLVGSRVRFGGDRRKAAGFAAYVDWTNTLLSEEQIRLNRFIESPVINPSFMYRASSLCYYGRYYECGMPEDYELVLRWLGQGASVSKTPEALVTWGDSPNRLSRVHSRYSTQAFYKCKAYYLARWLKANNPWHPEVVIYGAGRTTRKRAAMLEAEGIRIKAYIDIDPNKIGQRIHGRLVWSAQNLPEPGTCFVVSYVSRRGARDLVRRELNQNSYIEGRDFILC